MNLWLDHLIREARNGDDVAARALVGYLAVCLEKGKNPPDLVAYFLPALKRIARGRSADSALNLGGESTRSNLARDYEIAREVWKLNHRADDRLPLRASLTKSGAYDEVGERHRLSAERVEQIYKALRPLVEAEFFELENSEDDTWNAIRHHYEVDMWITFAHFVDTLRK